MIQENWKNKNRTNELGKLYTSPTFRASKLSDRYNNKMIEIAGGVVWNPKLGIVVVSQNNNSWSLPKGHVEDGEDNFTAAIREIAEETGIPESALTYTQKSVAYDRTRTKRDPSDADEIRHITLYIFKSDWEELSPIDPENPEARWVAPGDVPTLLTHPIDKIEFGRMIKADFFNMDEYISHA